MLCWTEDILYESTTVAMASDRAAPKQGEGKKIYVNFLWDCTVVSVKQITINWYNGSYKHKFWALNSEYYVYNSEGN